MTTKPTEVVVAVAFDKDGRFLMTHVPKAKSMQDIGNFRAAKSKRENLLRKR